jgi:hypothetical protein
MPSPNRGPLLTSKVRGTVDNFPKEFLSLVGLDTTSQKVPLDVDPEPITGLRVESKTLQELTDERRLVNTFLTEIPDDTLDAEVMLPSGLVATRSRMLVPDPTDIVANVLTESADQHNLGNGWLDQVVVTAPSLFHEQLFARERQILGAIPAEFRAGITQLTTSQVVEGTATDPGPLTGAVEYASQQQINVFKKKVEQRGLDFTVIGTLTNFRMTQEQQLESLTVQLTDVEPSPASFTALTVESEIKALGGGLWLVTQGTVPDVFQAKRSSINTLDLIPQEFRGLIPDFEVSEIVAGTIVDPPVLTGTEIAKSEEQLTVFKKKVSARTLGNPTLPLTYANQEIGAEQFGGELLSVELTLNSSPLTIPVGEDVTEAITRTLSPSLYLRSVKKRSPAASWPLLTSRLWDPEMRLEYTQTDQVVAAGTAADPNPGVFGWISEVKTIDKWRSRKTNTSKSAPAYISKATALISYEYKPYRFPGLIYFSGTGYYVRHADATLCQHKIRTWWLQSVSAPTVGPTGSGSDVEIDEIIMDDVVINDLSLKGLTYSGPALHDDLQSGTLLFYPATTPSHTQYALGTPTGTSTLHNFAGIYVAGTGYTVGNVLTISGAGHSMTATVTFVDGSGAIQLWTNGSGTFPVGSYGPFLAGGGSGSGAYFSVVALEVPNYTPGSQWIGTYRVVGATVKPEKEVNVWRVVTEEVIMR